MLLACLLLSLATVAGAVDIHHALRVSLDPANQSLSVTDRITLPANAPNDLLLALHADLQLRITQPADARLETLGVEGRIARYRLRLAAGTREVELAYRGRLYHAL